MTAEDTTAQDTTAQDWHEWHDAYDDPDSWQAQRLVTVRRHIRATLDTAPEGPVRVLAMVAGQGRDVIPVLADHSRRHEVTARLVELDPRNTDLARDGVRAAGLSTVEVVTGDAALIDHYQDLAPADLLLICGLFPHITAEDIARVVAHAGTLTKRGGTVIWTQHRRDPDSIGQVAGWFAEQGFAEVWTSGPEVEHAVGVHRLERDPRPVVPGTKLFTFVGVRTLRPWEFRP